MGNSIGRTIFFFFFIRYAEPLSPGYWLIRIALDLSGHDQLYSWTTWESDKHVDTHFGNHFW
ncbi:hypothetical protein ACFS07_02185 [Undibacterium arcticum]